MKKLRTPFKTHGGKFYLSDWIVSHFPPNYENMTYYEPYCGGCSVLLSKKPSVIETASDLDYGIYSFFYCVKHYCIELVSRLNKVLYNKFTFKYTRDAFTPTSMVDCATKEFILHRMSRGGLKKDFSTSTRLRGGQNELINSWQNAIKLLPQISIRLQNVHLRCQDAHKLQYNDTNDLVYLDPPYLPSTRVSNNTYEYDLTERDHIDLLYSIVNARSKIILSGYPSILYSTMLKDWRMVAKDIANHSGQTKKKTRRVECIWMNY